MGSACCRGDQLQAATLDTPLFSLEGRTFRAKCVKVYDGDTIHVVIVIRGQLVRFKCRMSGYDSAELNSTDPGLKNAAHVAKDVLAEKINGKIVDVYCGKFDKYGRLLVVVYYGGQNINDWMIEHGYGTVYDGRGAKYGAVKVPPAK